MEVIDQMLACDANYDTTHITTTASQYNSYAELEALFNEHRSQTASGGTYIMPYYWAQHVAEAVKDLLTINKKIRFVDVREKNSKLILNLHYPDAYDEKIHFRVHKIKNLIDRMVHVRIRRVKVARSFHYDVYPFC